MCPSRATARPATRAGASSARRPRKPVEAARLTRDDWLDAAFEAVVEGGFDNIRVLAIADGLGVTRGSFYWHFTDHPALVAALLQRWRERQASADRLLEAVHTDDPRADLQRVLDAALARGGTDFKEMRFELALRDLARRDPEVGPMLIEVDESRRALLESKFLRLTGDARSAAELAVLFYLSIAGAHQALARTPPMPRLGELLRHIIDAHLISRHAPEPAPAPAKRPRTRQAPNPVTQGAPAGAARTPRSRR